jgi:hypothetical protein
MSLNTRIHKQINDIGEWAKRFHIEDIDTQFLVNPSTLREMLWHQSKNHNIQKMLDMHNGQAYTMVYNVHDLHEHVTHKFHFMGLHINKLPL